MASLVPAATDLLIEMGCADKLLAVSTFDLSRPGMKPLPKVGDYQNTDWEKLAELKPEVMIIQVQPARLPAEFASRVQAMGMRLVNVKIDRLADLDLAIKTLGDAVNEPAKAERFREKLHGQLEAVKQHVSGQAQVRTLLTRDETGLNVIGPDNFVDDLLTIAGGSNAVGGDVPWPTIDNERLAAINPEVVIQLLPEAPQQLLEHAEQVWRMFPELSAVKSKRVYVVRDWYALQPGGHVGELAMKLAELLHPVRP